MDSKSAIKQGGVPTPIDSSHFQGPDNLLRQEFLYIPGRKTIYIIFTTSNQQAGVVEHLISVWATRQGKKVTVRGDRNDFLTRGPYFLFTYKVLFTGWAQSSL